MSPLKRITTRAAGPLVGLVLLAAFWVPAAGASADSIYQACRNGSSMNGFSKGDLQSALSGVPADLDEYYGCSAQINAAIIDKSVKSIPGGGRGIAGTKRKLKAASIDDLTTPAQRRRALAQAERSTPIDPDHPLARTGDAAIRMSDDRTLVSTIAPGSPTALIVGLIALMALLGAEFARRLSRSPRVQKFRQKPSTRDGD